MRCRQQSSSLTGRQTSWAMTSCKSVWRVRQLLQHMLTLVHLVARRPFLVALVRVISALTACSSARQGQRRSWIPQQSASRPSMWPASQQWRSCGPQKARRVMFRPRLFLV